MGDKEVKKVKKDNNYYIVRAEGAGVTFGKILERDQKNKTVVMTKARRLWYWDGANSLYQLAQEGTKRPGNCNFSMEVEEAEIYNVLEILKCSKEAEENIKGVEIWKK